MNFGHFDRLTKLDFYKVSFDNLNTISLNEYFGRHNDPTEEVFLCFDRSEKDIDFESALDTFLCDTCYCDETAYKTAEKVSKELNDKLQDIAYEIREAIEDFGGMMPEEINASFIYRINSIYHC